MSPYRLSLIAYNEAAMHCEGNRRFYITRFPWEKWFNDCLSPKFKDVPKIIINGAIAVDLKGPLIIFNKEKGIINAKGNVDSKVYVDHVVSRLVEFYFKVRNVL
jgi:hypothetical protein